MEDHLDKLLEDKTLVVGEVYVITNTATGLEYVGQTWSHRKNRGKYRPFGSTGRLKDHVSEALCNSKTKQCTYLNNAIRKYGAPAFHVAMLQRCALDDLDQLEKEYIASRQTLYPLGYNLTAGGKTSIRVAHVEEAVQAVAPGKRGGRKGPHEAHTRELMSRRQKEMHANDTRLAVACATSARKQHMESRLKTFAGVAHLVDQDTMHSCLHDRLSKADGSLVFVRVQVGDLTTRFYPRGEEDPHQQAIEFLTTLLVQHAQIAGTPLEL